MQEEIKLILEMLERGDINVEEADNLIKQVNAKTAGKEVTVISDKKPINKKFLNIFIEENGKTIVNINIPAALAKMGLGLIPQDKLNAYQDKFDFNSIIDLIEKNADGDIVNIDTQEPGDKVKIRVSIQ